jgi:hypothetical protein
MNITINSKKYVVKFGYGAYRQVCEHYGETKVTGFNDLVKRFKLDKMSDPSFEQLGFIGNLVLAGISTLSDSDAITSDDVVDVLWKDAALMSKILEEFVKSMPQDSPQPKPRGRGK